MRRSKRRLGLEALETRLTPAGTVAFAGGNLRITGDNLANAIAVTQSVGKVGVVIDGANFGNYAVTGGIFVTGNNGNDMIDIKIGGNFAGSVNVDAGLGNDVVTLQGTGTAGPRVQGATSILTSLGDDVVTLGSDGALIGLTSVTVRTDIGADKLNVRNANIQGSLITYGTDSVTIGQGSMGQVSKSSVAGQVLVNNTGDGLPGNFLLTGGSVLGSLTIIGGNGGNLVRIGPNSGPAPFGLPTVGGTIYGDATLILGSGNDVVTLEVADLHGSLTVICYNGADQVNLLNGTTIAGNATLYLGDGNNRVAGATEADIFGNLTITTGNGDDTVNGPNAKQGFDSDVFGRFDLNVGNGANVFAFEGTLAGRMSYLGGGGNDSVSLTGGYAFAIDIRLGAGDDTFTFGANTRVGSAFIDFGAGADTYNDGGNNVDWPMTIVGL